MASGIYVITNTVTGEQYIGSSRDINARLSSHKSELRRGEHTNKRMQESWSTHGEQVFTFAVLDEVSDESDLIYVEMAHIERLQPIFNVRGMTRKYTIMSSRSRANISSLDSMSVSLSTRAYDALKRITKARFGGVDRRISATIEQLVIEEEKRLNREERQEQQQEGQANG